MYLSQFPRVRTALRKLPLTKIQSRGFASRELPAEADVVVVGGGSLGTAILYHLQCLGLNSVVLERDKLTSGTTWHSAGMLWSIRPSDVEVELNAYSRHMCKQLEEETGVASWRENGGLFIASNEERLSEYKRLAELGKYYGIPSTVLTPDQVKEVHPLLRTDDVCGAVHSPYDGTIDPTGIVNAYSKAARSRGGLVFEDTVVSDIETEQYRTKGGEEAKRVTAVLTADGQRIRTKHVVNACGAWANELAAMVQATIPLRAMKHAMVVTETIEGMHADLPNVRDHDLSVYLKTQGDSMCIGGYERNPEFWDKVEPKFTFGLFELDYDTFGQNLEGHLQRCPAIETVGIKSTVCGPESFTPDHKALVGPQQGVRGFWNACGFNSMGMMQGGGIARELALWIQDGSPSLDLFSFDCNRFHPSTVTDTKWVMDRTHESYAKTYAIVFPHDEALAGRGARVSPVHDALVERGCVHQARHGMERPGWFCPDSPSSSQAPISYDYYGAYDEEGAWRLGLDDGVASIAKHESNRYLDLIEGELTFGWPASHSIVAEECRAARNGVAIFDQSYFGKFFLRGPDASEAVQYLCSADMETKPMGSVTYTTLCNARGGVEADLTVTKLEDDQQATYPMYYFAAGGATASKDLWWIQRVLDDKEFDAKISDESSTMSMISVQGPHSRALLQSLLPSDCSPDVLEDANLPFSTCRHVTIAGCEVKVLRLTFVGELGFELHAPAQHSDAIYRTLRAAGEEYEKAHGVPVRDAGYRAIDSLSAEKGYRHWHADISNRDTPMEAAIGFTVLPKLKREGDDAPNFLGRQALEEKRALGLQRKLICLTLDDASVPLHGMETIWRGGKCVGYVRSTAFGHTVGTSIAYGYVDLETANTNGVDDVPKKITNKWLQATEWAVGAAGERHAATFQLKAPFDPTNSRIKGQY
jgi:sarcosine dehydrogenase